MSHMHGANPCPLNCIINKNLNIVECSGGWLVFHVPDTPNAECTVSMGEQPSGDRRGKLFYK